MRNSLRCFDRIVFNAILAPKLAGETIRWHSSLSVRGLMADAVRAVQRNAGVFWAHERASYAAEITAIDAVKPVRTANADDMCGELHPEAQKTAESEIRALVGQRDVRSSVRRLVEAANAAGGPDNISALVLRRTE